MQEEINKILEEKNIHLWFYGSPVTLCSTQLILNTKTGELFASAKFLNVQPEPIKEITVDIICYDTIHNPIDYIIDYKYSGLDIERNKDFGLTYKIPIKNQETRNIEFVLKSATTTGNEVWYNTDVKKFNVSLEQENIFSVQKNLNADFMELCAENNIDGSKLVFQPVFQDSHWMCACGCLNWNDEDKCSGCGISKQWLKENVSQEKLIAREKLRSEAMQKARQESEKKLKLDKEKQKEEFKNRHLEYEKQIQKQKNRKKTKTIIIITSILVVTAVLVFLCYTFSGSYFSYFQAKQALDNSDYDTAISRFTEVGDFLDSKELLNRAIYSKATYLYDSNQKSQAAKLYKSIENYSDSKQKYYETQYEVAKEYYKEKNYMGAADIYFQISEYLDSGKRLEAAYENIYNDAVEKMNHKKIDEAYSEFQYLGDYSDSQTMLKECHYKYAQNYYENYEYKNALNQYAEIKDYKDVPTILKDLKNLADIISAATDTSTPAVWGCDELECPVCHKKDSAEYCFAFGTDGNYSLEMKCNNHNQTITKTGKYKIEKDMIYVLEHPQGHATWNKCAKIISIEPLKTTVEGKNSLLTVTNPFGKTPQLQLYGNIISGDIISF
ncbi:MAG: hypothetical protein PUG48_03305 [Clostridia bacterium]|nr:hypothetical protein [Clostridia bacterium]